MTQLKKWQPPTITELSEHLEQFAQDDVLNMTLSSEPPARWLKVHPTVKVKVPDATGNLVSVPMQYIPVDKQRLLAKRLFGIVQIEIISTTQLFNSVCVTVRLHFKHPITAEPLYMDGIGAVGVQTDAGATASDMSKIKFDGVMKAAPAAAAYAEKNAYDKLGRLFGGEVQKDAIPFNENMAMYSGVAYPVDIDSLTALFNDKKECLTPQELQDAQRIINNQEKTSYNKLYKHLSTK